MGVKGSLGTGMVWRPGKCDNAILYAALGLALLSCSNGLLTAPHIPNSGAIAAPRASKCAPSCPRTLAERVPWAPAAALMHGKSAASLRAKTDPGGSASLESLGLPKDVRQQMGGLSEDVRNSIL